MTVYVVLCRYDGCDECNSGSHIVGVFRDEANAREAESAHSQDESAHLHSGFYVETEPQEVIG